MGMAVFRPLHTGGVGRLCSERCRRPHPLRRLQREGAEALTALVQKIALIVENEGFTRDSALRSRLVSKDEGAHQPCRGRRGKPCCEGGG